MLLEQLQVRVDKAELQRHRVLELLVGGGLVQVLGAGPQPELFVDFLVELAAPVLELPPAGGRPRVGTLEREEKGKK